MADTNFRGPVNSMGSLEIQSGATATIEPLDGPSLLYQGYGMPDIRSSSFYTAGQRPAQQAGFLSIPTTYAVDNFPQAASTTLLAASQAATAAVALSLVTAQVGGSIANTPSFAINVPIIQQGTAVVTTAPITLDFGFSTGTTTAGSTTIVTPDNTEYSLNQWIIVAGAGNSSATAALITQVVSFVANSTGIIVANAAATGLSNVPVGAGNLYGSQFLPGATQFGPSTSSANSYSNGVSAGFARAYNPQELLARNISVTAGTTTATTTVALVGADIWRQPMTEAITVPSGNRSATTFFGSKAFKHLFSATPSTTAGGSLSLGVGDVFGMSVRADAWEHTQIYWNGCYVPTKLGFTAAATTSPATNTTGDVRGTIQVSTNGTGTAAAVATASVSNGTARLTVIQNVGLWNTINGTPRNTVPMFGVTNSTT